MSGGFIFRTYCTSYYGSPLWQLDSNDVKHFYVSWRNCISKIWNIPARTHCRLLNHLCEGYSTDFELMSRFMSFYQLLSKSENICTHLCYLLCKTSLTTVSINRRLLLSKLNEDEYGNKEKCVANSVLLKELCLLRDGILTTDLSRSLIDFICTG